MKATSRRALFASAPVTAVAAGYWGPGAAVTPPARRFLSQWVLSRVRTDAPEVALTFDDGPDPRYTERYVEVLGRVPATFFVLGERARTWPGLVRTVVEAGHQVACHGDSHVSMAALGPRATADALRRARAGIEDASGSAPAFYRPAYGCFTAAAWVVAPRLGMRRTLWTAWAKDWVPDTPSPVIAARILRHAVPGAILLLHDSGTTDAPANTLAALPEILHGLAERGLRPVGLDALVANGDRPARRGDAVLRA